MEDSPYHSSKISEFETSQLPPGFYGNVYNLSYKWTPIIPVSEQPVKIMEIGAYHGANTCSYMKSYARHPRSEIHCVDPWMDYDGYDEYQSKQHTNYSLFIQNLARLSPEDLHKVHLHRGLSETMIPRFADNMFDIIYIDGNHVLRYVLQDAIQSYHKIKRGGWIIFDDMQDKEVNQAVQMFLMSHSTDFDSIQIQNAQLFMRRRG